MPSSETKSVDTVIALGQLIQASNAMLNAVAEIDATDLNREWEDLRRAIKNAREVLK